jgi:hypothetical protein
MNAPERAELPKESKASIEHENLMWFGSRTSRSIIMRAVAR